MGIGTAGTTVGLIARAVDGGAVAARVAERGVIAARADRSAIRVLTLNIHMATPAGVALEPANESMAALRDVASYIRDVDPDVVFLQEVRQRPWVAGQQGISDVVEAIAQLAGASDHAFSPAVDMREGTNGAYRYGTALVARNGFSIEQHANVALPNDVGLEARSAGVFAMRAPDARGRFTAVGTHLAHRVVEDQPLRDRQLSAIAGKLDALDATGRFDYVDAMTGKARTATGFPHGRTVLGGDLNQRQGATDVVLGPTGFEHVADGLAGSGASGALVRAEAARRPTAVDADTGIAHRIDHLEARGFTVRDAVVADVPNRESFGPMPTDHAGVYADLT